MSSNPHDWTPAQVEAACAAYNAAPDNATKSELRAAMDAARAQAMENCTHKGGLTGRGGEWSCSDCGEALPYPGGCSHRYIDNDTWSCKECGERMVNRTEKPQTVLSAPNAAPCRNPEHLAAMEAGEEFECDHPYVPDVSRQQVVLIGTDVDYECQRCRYEGTVFSAGDVPIWDCGHWHIGDRIPAAAPVGG